MDLANLRVEDVSCLPPEFFLALKEDYRTRRLLAQSYLETGDIAGWAEGLRIRTTRGFQEMHPYPYQKKVWAAGKKNRFRILLKARQIGITEAIATEMYAQVKMDPAAYILFVSAKQETANEALEKVYRNNEADGDCGLTLVVKTKSYAQFSNGAKIHSLPASEESSVGHSATHVYLDEFAHMPFAGEIYEQILPTISRSGRICIVSTPRGQSGKFYELWRGAIAKQNGYWPLRVHWKECPAYNADGKGEKGAWYKEFRQAYSDTEWARQFECDFVASMDMFFSEVVMEWLRKQARAPIEVENLGGGSLYIWEQPKKHAAYVIGADPASGLAHGDWSVAVILEAKSGEQVGMLRGHWQPYVFANHLYDLRARGYEGLLIVERPGPGLAVLEKLQELDPSNLFRSRSDGRVGWVTSVKTRSPMLNSLEEGLRRRLLKLHATEFVEEAETFVRDERGIPAASKGDHDDVILATAMAWYVRQQVPTEPSRTTSWTQREESSTGY